MIAFETNFDGIVGPTHNYAGLSFGNVASMANRQRISRPRAAALEGLAKMKFLADLGVRQAVLPPHERPHMPTLRRLGFAGKDPEIVEKAAREDPVLLAGVCSASSMWAANAATVSPSADCADGRVHFTPANLISHFHRAIEPQTTATILRAIFADEKHFAHHLPLPAATHLSDEGAANHTRLSASHGDAGVELFTFGRVAFDASSPLPKKFPARQTREASSAIARLHWLDHSRTIFVQQNPDAIDAGAFHNDVVAVGNENVLLHHELAFAGSDEAIVKIREAFAGELHVVTVADAEVPLADAVATYLFNSQLVTLPDGNMSLIAPIESRDNPRTRAFLAQLPTKGTPIKSVHFVDVRQSMANGGGPACLRLRVALRDDELTAMHQGVLLTKALHDALRQWIETNYREEIHPNDLADPHLLTESQTALDKLTQLLNLGSIYEFQLI